jgi:hypothetical protein
MNGPSSISNTVVRTGLAQRRSVSELPPEQVSTSVAKLRDRGWVNTVPTPAT